MKSNHYTKNAGRLAAYSAMAGAFVAIANESDATVVYTDPADVTVDLGFYLPVDIDADGHVDFLILCTSIATNWTVGVEIGYYAGLSYGNPSNQVVGYLGILPYGSALDFGDAIDAGASFLAYNTAFLASIYSSGTYGAFANTTDKYMGFQFIAGDGNLHYGWMRLDVSVGPVSITVKDFAYDDSPHTAIVAGDMGGPSCDVPAGFSSLSIANAAKLQWGGVMGATGYHFQYRLTGTAAWTNSFIAAPKHFKKLLGLTCETGYEWRVRATCDGGASFSDWSAIQSFTTGACRLEDMKEFDMQVFPNPASDLITVNVPFATESGNIAVYDLNGALIMSDKLSGDTEYTFDISALPTGTYFIRWTGDSTSAQEMFIKQ
ncbi:MAG: T9SS type A sorting domain-containing protein [Chitinophagales bacterium]